MADVEEGSYNNGSFTVPAVDPEVPNVIDVVFSFSEDRTQAFAQITVPAIAPTEGLSVNLGVCETSINDLTTRLQYDSLDSGKKQNVPCFPSDVFTLTYDVAENTAFSWGGFYQVGG